MELIRYTIYCSSRLERYQKVKKLLSFTRDDAHKLYFIFSSCIKINGAGNAQSEQVMLNHSID